MKKLLDIAPDTGLAHTFHLDEATGDARIVASQDITPLLDANKAQANEPVARRANWRKVASLDMATWFKLKQEGILDDPKALKRWLNDPENRWYRTSPEYV